MPYYPQPVTVKDAGTAVGTQPAINFIEGTNVTLTITNDPTNQEVDVEIAASGGGGSPAGSDTQIQYNNSGAFGASAAFRFGTSGAISDAIILGIPGTTGGKIVAANGESGNINGVNFDIQSGRPFDDGMSTPANGGSFNNTAQDGINGGSGGAFDLTSGGSDSGPAGTLGLFGGYSDSGQGANVEIEAGGTDSGTPGNVTISAGTPDTSAPGGSVDITATDGAGTNQNGGNVNITIGAATGTGTPGNLIITGLPTADPGVSGALWVDGSNFLKVSP